MGLFHCRPITPSEDFILTSPATIEELGDYRTNSKKHSWYFCKQCGVRFVALGGEWEQVDMDVEQWACTKSSSDKEDLRKVWKTKGITSTTEEDGKTVTKPLHYLSVNAVTLEPSEDIDLRKWHENGWVFYVQSLKKETGSRLRLNEPYWGGMY